MFESLELDTDLLLYVLIVLILFVFYFGDVLGLGEFKLLTFYHHFANLLLIFTNDYI